MENRAMKGRYWRPPWLTQELDQRATWARLDRIIDILGDIVTEQEHLDADVSGITTAIGTAVAELKQQIADGTHAANLDFTGLDALVASTAAEATADAPPPPPTP